MDKEPELILGLTFEIPAEFHARGSGTPRKLAGQGLEGPYDSLVSFLVRRED